jgi:hypothetical protein
MASTYLSKTFSSGNQQEWTWSAWVKKSAPSAPSASSMLFTTGQYASTELVQIFSQDTLNFTVYDSGGGGLVDVRSSNLVRDPSAWYHFVVAVDTTQATASNRVKLYINGVEASYSSTTYPSLNASLRVNSSSVHNIGFRIGSSFYFDGLMTHIHFTDGTQYQASDFGETDATTGIWKPIKEPSVTYGTNGFFLKFENSGSMGLDSSGNVNNFTVNGSLTQTVDTPSNVFTTWNPLENYYQSATLSNGNTTIQTGNSQYSPSSSTLGVSSGKWYWEVEYDALSGGSDVAYVGVLSQFATNSTTSLGTNANDYGYYVNGNYYNNNTGTAYGTTYTTGDIIGVALDLDNNKLYFSKNGTWQNSGDPESGATGTGAISITNPTSTTNGAYFPSICDGSSSANATFKTNFGNGYFGTTAVASAGSNGNGSIFEFDCPSGYYALNTKNINTYG